MKQIVVCPVERVVIQVKRSGCVHSVRLNNTHIWGFLSEYEAEALAINLEAALLRPAKRKSKR